MDLGKINKLYNDTKASFLESKTLYQGKFIKLIEEDYLLPNGIIMPREKIIKNNNKESVIVITITIDNKFILVSQNRINGVTLEFPSGYVEENETIFEAALRELQEETGYTSNNIELIDSFYPQPSIDNSIINIVIVKDAVLTNEQRLGNYEYINYDEFSFEELQELINLNYINGCGNKLAYYELLNNYSINKVLKKH